MSQQNEKEQSKNEAGKKPPQPVKAAHKCSICGSPDYRACGCEAKESQLDVPTQVDETLERIGEAVIDVLGENTAESVSQFAEVIKELERRRQVNLEKSLASEQFGNDMLGYIAASLVRIADALETKKGEKPAHTNGGNHLEEMQNGNRN